MSTAIVTITLSLDRKDHSRKIDEGDLLALAESELDGAEWWDDDYGYDVTVQRVEVVTNDTRKGSA